MLSLRLRKRFLSERGQGVSIRGITLIDLELEGGLIVSPEKRRCVKRNGAMASNLTKTPFPPTSFDPDFKQTHHPPRRNDRSPRRIMLYFSLYATFRQGLQSNP